LEVVRRDLRVRDDQWRGYLQSWRAWITPSGSTINL
jgi:hypothetical protein